MCPIVMRLTCAMNMHDMNQGKACKTVRIAKHHFKIIRLMLCLCAFGQQGEDFENTRRTLEDVEPRENHTRKGFCQKNKVTELSEKTKERRDECADTEHPRHIQMASTSLRRNHNPQHKVSLDQDELRQPPNILTDGSTSQHTICRETRLNALEYKTSSTPTTGNTSDDQRSTTRAIASEFRDDSGEEEVKNFLRVLRKETQPEHKVSDVSWHL